MVYPKAEADFHASAQGHLQVISIYCPSTSIFAYILSYYH